jgi:hypothetical protein
MPLESLDRYPVEEPELLGLSTSGRSGGGDPGTTRQNPRNEGVIASRSEERDSYGVTAGINSYRLGSSFFRFSFQPHIDVSISTLISSIGRSAIHPKLNTLNASHGAGG